MIIDRFEGDYAVIELENGSFENLPKVLLPKNVKEGDCIIVNINKNTTVESRNRIRSKMDNLFLD